MAAVGDRGHHDLSEELICEILSWLPTKSLVRFRSVSKSICDLIGSPGFIRLHSGRQSKSNKKYTVLHRVNYSPTEPGGGLVKTMYTIHNSSDSDSGRLSYMGTTPVEYPFRDKNIVGPCNGIVAVYEYHRNIIHLWNPSIRRTATVSSLPPWVPGVNLGFGFDTINHDYKILWIAAALGQVSSFVYTINNKTNASWREIPSPAMARFSAVNSQLCHFNGALYWAVKMHLRRSDCYMMKFDLSSEVFSTIDLPEPSVETNTVTIIKGSLAVVYASYSKDDDCRVWLRTSAASWSLAFKLDARLRQPVNSIIGDLLFSCYYSNSNKGILHYHDPDTGLPSSLLNLTESSSYVCGMITCIESLELLDTGTSCDQKDTTGRGENNSKQHALDGGRISKEAFAFLDRCDQTVCRERGGLLLADTKTAEKKINRGFTCLDSGTTSHRDHIIRRL